MTDRSGSRIDHLNIAVPDLAAAKEFYGPVLESIGIALMLDIPAGRLPRPRGRVMTRLAEPQVDPGQLDPGPVGRRHEKWFGLT